MTNPESVFMASAALIIKVDFINNLNMLLK